MDEEYNENDLYNDNDDNMPVNELNYKHQLVQPDKKILKGMASRNLGLGFITPLEYNIMKREGGLAIEYSEYPNERGGWITKAFATSTLKKMEISTILSGSLNGQLRQSLHTQRTVNLNKEMSNRKGSGIAGFFSKNDRSM